MTRPLLITAGATRNFIDNMRCITANASGKTGANIAQSFPIQCTLLGSPSALAHLAIRTKTSIAHHPTIQTQEFTSTEDLHEKMKKWVQTNRHGIVIHSAAVGDYAPQQQPGKISSGESSLTITLYPTVKILDEIKKWDPSCLLVSFKAAPPQTSSLDLSNIARAQLQRSQSDLVFANVLTQTGQNVQLVSMKENRIFEQRDEAITKLIEWISLRRSKDFSLSDIEQ